jgi:hypothetical protein
VIPGVILLVAFSFSLVSCFVLSFFLKSSTLVLEPTKYGHGNAGFYHGVDDCLLWHYLAIHEARHILRYDLD